jgi:hypothetical protein
MQSRLRHSAKRFNEGQQSLSSKYKPTNVVVIQISGGIRITWNALANIDNYEVWVSINSAPFVILAIITSGTTYYDDLTYYAGVPIAYKIRAITGSIYSDFSAEAIIQLSYVPAFLLGMHTFAIYEPLATNGRLAASGIESIYWDQKIAYGTLGAEQNSGVIVLYAVYKITACQTNFFYTGCTVGDTFVCGTVKTCDSNNKVQLYTGNHLTQPVVARRPTNQVFNGVHGASGSFMKTAPFTLTQPFFIYIVFNPVSWASLDVIFDGSADFAAALIQHTATPQVQTFAGSYIGTSVNPTVGQSCIMRCLFNNTNSKMILANGIPVTGTVGNTANSGFTLGNGGGGGTSYSANIGFSYAAITDGSEAGGSNETAIYNYLTAKYSL